MDSPSLSVSPDPSDSNGISKRNDEDIQIQNKNTNTEFAEDFRRHPPPPHHGSGPRYGHHGPGPRHGDYDHHHRRHKGFLGKGSYGKHPRIHTDVDIYMVPREERKWKKGAYRGVWIKAVLKCKKGPGLARRLEASEIGNGLP